MKNNYKIVAVTPAGRKMYLEILYKYLCKNKHLLDRWDIWVNTKNESDLNYIKELGEKDSFINIIYPDWPYESSYPNLSITPFWSKATDEDTIYIRFDDDVVFIDDNTIENLIDFRINNPEYFFIYPFIINNTHHSKDLQLKGLITEDYGVIGEYQNLHSDGINDRTSLHNMDFIRYLHEKFISYYNENNYNLLMTPEKIVWDMCNSSYQYNSNGELKKITNGTPQIAINCVCWFGSLFKKICPINNCFFDGEITQRDLTDEEAYITIVKTKEMNMFSCTAPNTLIVHFLFHTQRGKDGLNDILEQYKKIAND